MGVGKFLDASMLLFTGGFSLTVETSELQSAGFKNVTPSDRSIPLNTVSIGFEWDLDKLPQYLIHPDRIRTKFRLYFACI